MADTTLGTVTPGSSTTEFQLTKYVMLVGGLLTLIFGLLTQVQQSGLLPDESRIAHILAAVLSGLAALLTVVKALGYTNARASVKNAAQLAAAQVASQATPTAAPGPQ